ANDNLYHLQLIMIILEELMYRISALFLAPVLLLLVVLLAYACYSVGSFTIQALQRHLNKKAYYSILNSNLFDPNIDIPKGYPLLQLAISNSNISKDELDIAAMKRLEEVRMISRLAPMLGLIATMIPMGPALKSLSDGNIQGISENLIIAFSAVIIGLVIASITFWIASFKKRWFAAELVDVNNYLEAIRSSKANEQEESTSAINNIDSTNFDNIEPKLVNEKN
ncbi:MAG: MotA/TolQ/ExbB proton channel family protein, partial [Pseudomonadota bacterium]